MNPDLLMTAREYNETRHKTPYVFSSNKDNQFLFYFGCKHTRDPRDEQFEEIKNFWSEFLTKTKKHNCVVLIESNPLPTIIGEQDGVIKEFGERGFMVWLAEKEKVPFYHPELQIGEEAEILAKHFPKKLIVYFYFIRSVRSWLEGERPENFENVLRRAANACQQRINWQDVSCSVEDIKEIHKEIFGEELSIKNKETINRAPVPIYYDSVINDIARESSRIRNIKILEEIEKFWEEGKNIFILYGASHAVVQERAVKSIVGDFNKIS